MAKINLKKYRNIILYLASKLGGVIRGKKKLAKLLYFVDFDFFEKMEKSMTGEKYKALPMGPFPMHMEAVVDELKKRGYIGVSNIEEKEGYNATEIYKIPKDLKLDSNIFGEEELEVLNRVVTKYGHLSGKQLEDLTHAEAPYIGTKPNEIIAYELAFYRGTDFSNCA